jgi:hypothetical protein
MFINFISSSLFGDFWFDRWRTPPSFAEFSDCRIHIRRHLELRFARQIDLKNPSKNMLLLFYFFSSALTVVMRFTLYTLVFAQSLFGDFWFDLAVFRHLLPNSRIAVCKYGGTSNYNKSHPKIIGKSPF